MITRNDIPAQITENDDGTATLSRPRVIGKLIGNRNIAALTMIETTFSSIQSAREAAAKAGFSKADTIEHRSLAAWRKRREERAARRAAFAGGRVVGNARRMFNDQETL